MQRINQAEKQHRNWVENLQNIRSALQNTIANTEDDFLNVGSGLFSLQQNVSGLTQSSYQALDLISGKNTEEVLNGITIAMDEISHSLDVVNKHIKRDMSILEKIGVTFSDVHDFQRAFKKVVKNLQVYSKATRIESSRLHTLGEDFHTLAHNVGDLSVIIHEKFTKFFRSLNSLQGLLARTISSINTLEKEHLQKTQENINNSLINLVMLTGKQTDSMILANEVSRQSADISKSMNTIVMNLQSQDATRQIVEHVITAIEKLCDDIQQADNNENNNFNPDTLMDISIETLAVSRLQHAQLEKARKDFVKSVENILRNMQTIGDRVSLLNRDINSLGNANNALDNSFFKKIEGDISGLITTLMANSENREKLIDYIVTVSNDITDFSGFINDIEEIGENIELIAMNARIKAARVGAEGAALAIIAEHIQQNSLETQRHTASLLKLLKSTTGVATSLQNSREKSDDEVNMKPQQMMLDLEKQLHSFRGIQKTIGEMLTKTATMSDQIKMDLRKRIGSVSVHRVFDQSIGEISHQLQKLIRNIEIHTPELPLERVQERLRELEKNYTMESERSVHSAILTVDSAETADKKASAPTQENEPEFFDEFENFDLFDDGPAVGDPQMEQDEFSQNDSQTVGDNEEADDLGDNVDLF
ncbi:MAG: methyl-accepting chemotaxis protein [Calditrichia bacterium]